MKGDLIDGFGAIFSRLTFEMLIIIPGRGSSGVEQLIRNQQVVGSIPILGSEKVNCRKLIVRSVENNRSFVKFDF